MISLDTVALFRGQINKFSDWANTNHFKDKSFMSEFVTSNILTLTISTVP